MCQQGGLRWHLGTPKPLAGIIGTGTKQRATESVGGHGSKADDRGRTGDRDDLGYTFRSVSKKFLMPRGYTSHTAVRAHSPAEALPPLPNPNPKGRFF